MGCCKSKQSVKQHHAPSAIRARQQQQQQRQAATAAKIVPPTPIGGSLIRRTSLLEPSSSCRRSKSAREGEACGEEDRHVNAPASLYDVAVCGDTSKGEMVSHTKGHDVEPQSLKEFSGRRSGDLSRVVHYANESEQHKGVVGEGNRDGSSLPPSFSKRKHVQFSPSDVGVSDNTTTTPTTHTPLISETNRKKTESDSATSSRLETTSGSFVVGGHSSIIGHQDASFVFSRVTGLPERDHDDDVDQKKNEGQEESQVGGRSSSPNVFGTPSVGCCRGSSSMISIPSCSAVSSSTSVVSTTLSSSSSSSLAPSSPTTRLVLSSNIDNDDEFSSFSEENGDDALFADNETSRRCDQHAVSDSSLSSLDLDRAGVVGAHADNKGDDVYYEDAVVVLSPRPPGKVASKDDKNSAAMNSHCNTTATTTPRSTVKKRQQRSKIARTLRGSDRQRRRALSPEEYNNTATTQHHSDVSSPSCSPIASVCGDPLPPPSSPLITRGEEESGDIARVLLWPDDSETVPEMSLSRQERRAQCSSRSIFASPLSRDKVTDANDPAAQQQHHVAGAPCSQSQHCSKFEIHVPFVFTEQRRDANHDGEQQQQEAWATGSEEDGYPTDFCKLCPLCHRCPHHTTYCVPSLDEASKGAHTIRLHEASSGSSYGGCPGWLHQHRREWCSIDTCRREKSHEEEQANNLWFSATLSVVATSFANATTAFRLLLDQLQLFVAKWCNGATLREEIVLLLLHYKHAVQERHHRCSQHPISDDDDHDQHSLNTHFSGLSLMTTTVLSMHSHSCSCCHTASKICGDSGVKGSATPLAHHQGLLSDDELDRLQDDWGWCLVGLLTLVKLSCKKRVGMLRHHCCMLQE